MNMLNMALCKKNSFKETILNLIAGTVGRGVDVLRGLSVPRPGGPVPPLPCLLVSHHPHLFWHAFCYHEKVCNNICTLYIVTQIENSKIMTKLPSVLAKES